MGSRVFFWRGGGGFRLFGVAVRCWKRVVFGGLGRKREEKRVVIASCCFEKHMVRFHQKNGEEG